MHVSMSQSKISKSKMHSSDKHNKISKSKMHSSDKHNKTLAEKSQDASNMTNITNISAQHLFVTNLNYQHNICS